MNKRVAARVRAINVQRADNYKSHFKCRVEVKAMEPGQRDQIAHAAGHLSAPHLNLWGATSYSRDEKGILIALADQIGMNDPWLINPWYVSEAGWAAFQDAWKALPEPVDFTVRKLSTAPVDKSRLIHSPLWITFARGTRQIPLAKQKLSTYPQAPTTAY